MICALARRFHCVRDAQGGAAGLRAAKSERGCASPDSRQEVGRFSRDRMSKRLDPARPEPAREFEAQPRASRGESEGDARKIRLRINTNF